MLAKFPNAIPNLVFAAAVAIAVLWNSASGQQSVFPGNIGSVQTQVLLKGTGTGNYVSASTTYAAVDSTNLSLTVTIPVGWKLTVHAFGTTTTQTASAQDSVGLNDGACSGATVNLQNVNVLPPSANGMEAWALGGLITGDGASHTINLCYLTSNTNDAATIANSSASNAPVMIFTLSPSN